MAININSTRNTTAAAATPVRTQEPTRATPTPAIRPQERAPATQSDVEASRILGRGLEDMIRQRFENGNGPGLGLHAGIKSSCGRGKCS